MGNNILLQAQMYSDNEEYEKAYELLKNSYDSFKDDPEFLEKIALAAKILDKNDEAAMYWEQLVVADSQSAIGYSELMDIYLNQNKYKYYITRGKYNTLNEKINYAVEDYKKAIKSTNEPDEIVNARFLLAKAYEFLGKIQEAIDEYHGMLEHKDDPAIYYKLADLYAQSGDRYSAINVLEKAVKVKPDVPDLREYLSALYMKEGKYDKSLEYAVSDFAKIKALLMTGDNSKAFEMLSNIEDKSNANYPALMAEYYFNLKDYDNCSKYIEDFKSLDNQNPLVYQMSALVCDAKGDNYGYHYNMGRCYSFRQDYEHALVEYLNAHRIDANKSAPVKEIIKINEANGDKTSLMEFYEKLVRQEPDNSFALKGLGDVYFDMYEHREALNYYTKASETEPSDYNILLKIGTCYEKLRNNVKAVEVYEKYVSTAPLSPDTEKIKEKIVKLKNVQGENPEVAEEGFIDKIIRFFGKK